MEVIGKGVSIKHIFLDRGNWRRFHCKMRWSKVQYYL